MRRYGYKPDDHHCPVCQSQIVINPNLVTGSQVCNDCNADLMIRRHSDGTVLIKTLLADDQSAMKAKATPRIGLTFIEPETEQRSWYESGYVLCTKKDNPEIWSVLPYVKVNGHMEERKLTYGFTSEPEKPFFVAEPQFVGGNPCTDEWYDENVIQIGSPLVTPEPLFTTEPYICQFMISEPEPKSAMLDELLSWWEETS